MTFDPGAERRRQKRIWASADRPVSQPVRTDERAPSPGGWRPAVLRSVDENAQEMTFELLDYDRSPPQIDRYETYGGIKTGYPLPTMAVEQFAGSVVSEDETITRETPLVFARKNRHGDWIIAPSNVDESDAIGAGLYVTGGNPIQSKCFPPYDELRNHIMYSAGHWYTKAPLVCVTHTGHAGARVGAAIYVFGGSTGALTAQGWISRYVPDAWTNLGLMLESEQDAINNQHDSPRVDPVTLDPLRRFCSAFAIDDKAYISGGEERGSPSDEIFKISSRLTEFTPLRSLVAKRVMPLYRMNHTAFAAKGAGYVVGGEVSDSFFAITRRWASNHLWKWNPDSDTWTGDTELTSLPAPGRKDLASFVIDDKAYVVGGGTPGDTSAPAFRNCDMYDPDNDSWTARDQLPYPGRAGLTAGALGNYGYAQGGETEVGSLIAVLNHDQYNPSADLWATGLMMPSPGRNKATASTL